MRPIQAYWLNRKTGGRTLGDWYAVLLMAVLLGYVFIGKGFAYQGVPPLLIGEIALVAGAIVFLVSGMLIPSLETLASRFLAIMILWVVVRTVPYFGVYGMDAPRDAVIIIYGAFAFIVIGLLLEDKRRLNSFLEVYGAAATVFVLASPVMFFITRFFQDLIPTFPAPNGEPISLWSFRPGQFGVHLSGAALFAFLGLHRVGPLWLPAFLATATMASATSRGAMLAVVIPLGLAALLGGRLRLLAKLAGYGVLGLGAVLLVEIAFFEFREVDTLKLL